MILLLACGLWLFAVIGIYGAVDTAAEKIKARKRRARQVAWRRRKFRDWSQEGWF